MRFVSRHYRPLSLDDAIACLERGDPLPARSIVVTFDDGYQDNYQYALPILAKYRVPATIYLVSSTLTDGRVLWTSRLRQVLGASRIQNLVLPGLQREPLPVGDQTSRAVAAKTLTNRLNTVSEPARRQWIDRIADEVEAPPAPAAEKWFLTRSQIREMRSYGITFGAHTVNHPNLPGLNTDEANFEIQQARTDLQRLLDTEINHFSYPNSGALHPHFTNALADMVRQAGYRSAVTSQRGPWRPGDDFFGLPRLGINRARSSLAQFATLLERIRLGRSAEVSSRAPRL
jgi:peptidoglycan/xylan/chitin deacetylase (PgdA/CDA1 family)